VVYSRGSVGVGDASGRFDEDTSRCIRAYTRTRARSEPIKGPSREGTRTPVGCGGGRIHTHISGRPDRIHPRRWGVVAGRCGGGCATCEKWRRGIRTASDCLHAVKPDERLACRADGAHKRLFIYALSDSGKGGFIYHARAGIFENRFGGASPRRRAFVRLSVSDGPEFAVFFAGVRDRKTERKSEIDGIDCIQAAQALRVSEKITTWKAAAEVFIIYIRIYISIIPILQSRVHECVSAVYKAI